MKRCVPVRVRVPHSLLRVVGAFDYRLGEVQHSALRRPQQPLSGLALGRLILVLLVRRVGVLCRSVFDQVKA